MRTAQRIVILGLLLALVAPPTAGAASFTVRPSVHQVGVLGAPAGAKVTLIHGAQKLQTATIDELGSHLFRNVDSGPGYRVRVKVGSDFERSAKFAVRDAADVPDPSFYASQVMTNGYGYITMRDGTTLSAQVALPGPPEEGPYPTVVEYSGYDPSSPTTGQPQFKLLMPLLGFAWVGVNIRGTGCSGGAFNFFETLQTLDGYDVIETVAAQPWSTSEIGMVGISYAGISQLFVARTRPPHLAAITPLSVIADTWRSMLYPGGIGNDGFALNWASERVEQNKWPNPDAPDWVVAQINGGDDICADNMLLRGQNVDLLAQIENHPNPSPAIDPEFAYDFPHGSDSLAPAEFIDQITAKVFIAGAWQDEQTGGHWATMLDRFSPDTFVRMVGQNGTHTESLDPWVAGEAIEFMQLYVGHQVPGLPAIVRAVAPVVWATIAGVNMLNFPPDRFTGMTYDAALQAFEAEPPLRILWETGNADGPIPPNIPGALIPRASSRFDAWPIPEAKAKTWYLNEGGTLTRQRPMNEDGADQYAPDPTLRPRKDFNGGNIWSANPTYNWQPVVDGASLSYLTDPLPRRFSMAGTGSVDLWISSTAVDSDVQVTLSEVRDDGKERYVQNGWLRLSHRKLDERSTPLSPVHSDEEIDMQPLVPGELVRARIALFPFAHQFRAGSRIRLTIQAPGGDRPEWTFDTPETGGLVTNTVARHAAHRSRLVLPMLPDQPALGDEPAACPSLRGQPCRDYEAPAG